MGREMGGRPGAETDGPGPETIGRDPVLVDAGWGAGGGPFALDGFRMSFRVPVLSDVMRDSGGPVGGSFEDVLDGRKMREKTLPFFRDARDT
jgi:hypothetical protein